MYNYRYSTTRWRKGLKDSNKVWSLFSVYCNVHPICTLYVYVLFSSIYELLLLY